MSRHIAVAALFSLLLAAAACADQPGPIAADDPVPAVPGGPVLLLTGGCYVTSATTNYNTEVNFELNDYGRILADADNAAKPHCVQGAVEALRRKLANTRAVSPNEFHRDFLRGAGVALIFAAAHRIAAQGYMTTALDAELRWVEGNFWFVPEPGCGLTVTDNCLDGYTQAASGFAWIAAYRYRRGDPRSSVDIKLDSAHNYIEKTFNETCIHKNSTTNGPLCDGSYLDLPNNARTLSLNEGFQIPAYGFGLMTSIAAAVLGWEAAVDTAFKFTAPQKAVARGLFEEAQRAIEVFPDSVVFRSTCIRPSGSGMMWTFDRRDAHCGGGPTGYKPLMYALGPFYEAKLGGIPNAGPYTSTFFEPGHFNLGAAQDFFHFGRYLTYGELGYDWWVNDRELMPFDRHNPVGALERVDGTIRAYGWACDRDAPSRPIRVELRANGKLVGSGLANQAGDATIAANCGGYSAHRFAITLTTGAVGYDVTATGLDYTFGSAPLACQVAKCTVPTVSVAWAQPSGVTWGPANTLTVAGHAYYGTGGVKLQWRDITAAGPWNTVSYQAPVQPDNTWSNTLPSSNYCHDFQIIASYAGSTSASFYYRGLTSGHCSEAARVIWIQPQPLVGWGTPGALVVAGQATGAPAGTTVNMWWRNVTTGGPWTRAPYSAPTDANGIWIHDIPSANFSQQYQVYVKYDAVTSATCTYAGLNSATWC